MWRAIKIEARVGHPPERVFPYLADPGRWAEFAPAVASRQRIGDGPPSVGSRWAAVDRIGPFRICFTDELTEVEPDTRVVWLSTSPWNSRVEYRLLPDADSTRILACYEGDVDGWLRLVALLPTAILARILMRDFHGLRRCLEAEDRAPGVMDVASPG
ncbi:MAG TPA: SRPBCC family protein [Candidatus Limnocylindria bacterium]|nr:SRPBCC family protein [Candidatus Limnocylindria bacterium]